MREAAWDHRLALAGWRSGKLNAANLMPLRYSGEKFNEELKVCAIQARMTAQWSDAVASWAEFRVWWAARPSDLVATWAAEFQTAVLEALRKQPVPSMALGVEELTQEVGQARLHETDFLLANDVKPPESVGHVTCREKKTRQWADTSRVNWLGLLGPKGQCSTPQLRWRTYVPEEAEVGQSSL